MKTTSLVRRPITKRLAAFGVTYALGVLTLSATDADAAFRRVGPQFCRSIYSVQNQFQGEYFQNNEPTTMYATCGVSDDSYFEHVAPTTLMFQGYQPSGGLAGYASACVKWSNHSGAACGAVTYFPNSNFNVSLDLSQWKANWGIYPYLAVALPSGGRIFGAAYWN